VGLLLGGLGAWTYLKHGHEEKEPEKKQEKKEESRVQHSTNGETFIKLDKETQQRCGLKLVALESVEAKPEIKAFGRVLDPTPLATELIDINTAKAALDASRKEYERLKVLHDQNQNISTRLLDTSEAAVKRDALLVQAAQAKLRLSWGKAIVEQKALTNLVESLVAYRAALVRIDLPIGQALTAPPSEARIAPAAAQGNLIPAKFLGLATSTEPQVQGQGFFFLVETNPPLPGAALSAWLTVDRKPKTGVLIPNSALVRFEGEIFVYRQKAEDQFEREQVKLDMPLKDGWLASGDVAAGDKIVVIGAQELLSEELKSGGGGD